MAYDGTVAETIEKYTEDLQISTRLEDRRDACRALKLLAKDYRVGVCTQAMDKLLNAIKTDRHDEELVNYCLDALNYIISGPLADSPAATWPDESDNYNNQTNKTTSITSNLDNNNFYDPAKELAEIFLKKQDDISINVVTILDTITDNNFKTRWVSVKIFYGLVRQTLDKVQEAILEVPLSIQKLIPLITEDQDLLRNDGLVLFVKLTQSNRNIQDLVAYEKCFDKLMFIIKAESYLNGTVVVVRDCLDIIYNLMLNNEKNQRLFREDGFIQELVPFFDFIQDLVPFCDQQKIPFVWTNEKTNCLMLVLQIIDSMIQLTNSSLINVQESQILMQRCGLLDKLCLLLQAHEMPIGILSGTLNTASDIVRGHLSPNANMVMPTKAMMPILLLSMVKEICIKR